MPVILHSFGELFVVRVHTLQNRLRSCFAKLLFVGKELVLNVLKIHQVLWEFGRLQKTFVVAVFLLKRGLAVLMARRYT